jgi:hypothetical protein
MKSLDDPKGHCDSEDGLGSTGMGAPAGEIICGADEITCSITVPVRQGRHFHAEYLFILGKLVSSEAKNRISLEDSCFHHRKNNLKKNP